MRLGVLFPTTEIGADPREAVAFAQAAEDLGFDHLNTLDHVILPDAQDEALKHDYYVRTRSFHEPLILFSFLAAVTRRIRFSTAILILPQRQTVLVAKQAAELDLLSGGRLRLGVGLGWNPLEYEALGMSFKTRARRMAEQVGLLRALWTREEVTFDADFDRVDAAGLNPMPVQRPIPIWFGGAVPAALRRAGRLAEGVLLNPRLTPGAEAKASMDYVRDGAVAAGRDPANVGVEGTVLVRDMSPDQFAEAAAGWRDLGATDLILRTMDCGFSGIDAHIVALRRFRAAYPDP